MVNRLYLWMKNKEWCVVVVLDIEFVRGGEKRIFFCWVSWGQPITSCSNVVVTSNSFNYYWIPRYFSWYVLLLNYCSFLILIFKLVGVFLHFSKKPITYYCLVFSLILFLLVISILYWRVRGIVMKNSRFIIVQMFLVE